MMQKQVSHSTLSQWLANFIKGQIENIFNVSGHVVSATTFQFCPCNGKAAILNLQMMEMGCVLIKFYLQTRWLAGFDLWALV